MLYTVDFTPQAIEDFTRIDKAIAQNIANKIEWLSQNAELIVHISLKGKFAGKYKLRVGSWRVIYSIEYDSNNITIYSVRHRQNVYKI
ncbi:MAG: type II toxin-antitoxin system RelE/ParE family toxin [Nitrospirae bacterium]|nr:type II toxin-antitoxin system RelE/ParE family toxin [Nitrospirota bacterium]